MELNNKTKKLILSIAGIILAGTIMVCSFGSTGAGSWKIVGAICVLFGWLMLIVLPFILFGWIISQIINAAHDKKSGTNKSKSK